MDQYSWDDTNAAGLTKLEEVLYSTAGNASGYDSPGRLTTYRFIRHATAWGAWGQYTALQAATYTHTFTLSYVARDSFLEGKATGSSSNSNFKASSTESRYDAAGRRDLIKDTTVIKDGPDLISRRKLAYRGDS